MDTAGKRPRRLRAKYTSRTNLTICTRGISLLRRACIECSGFPTHIRYREKCSRIFLALLCRPVSAPQQQLHPQLQKRTRGESRNGSGRSTEGSSPSRHRLKKRASERSSGKWMRRPSDGTTPGGNRPALTPMIMTEDAKTEKYTAGAPLRCVHRNALQV